MTKAERIEKDIKRHDAIIELAKSYLVKMNKAMKEHDEELSFEYRRNFDGIQEAMLLSEDMRLRFYTVTPCRGYGDKWSNRIEGMSYSFYDIEGGFYRACIKFTEEEMYN